MTTLHAAVRAAGPVFLAVLAGCSSGPRAVPVTGRVTVGGRPLSGGTVIFHPADAGGRPARADVGPDGRYAAAALGIDGGLPPGAYAVSLMPRLMPEVNATKGKPPPQLPRKYGSPTTSGLALTVAEADASKTFNLEWPL